MPPAGSSLGSWKLLIVTPGRLLNAFSVICFDRETLSKIVPKAVTRTLSDEIVQVKLGLCNRNVANSVKLNECQYIILMFITFAGTHPSSSVITSCPDVT